MDNGKQKFRENCTSHNLGEHTENSSACETAVVAPLPIINKKKKRKWVIIAVAMTLAVVIAMIVIFNSFNKTLIVKGDGQNFKFTEIDELVSLSQYKYDEQDPNYWDYYSVEYELDSFEFTYSYYSGSSKKTLEDIEIIHINGIMAHTNGLYYIKESYSGADDIEVLVDTIYNAYAVRVGNFFTRLFDDRVTVGNGWICWSAGDSSVDSDIRDAIKGMLVAIEHFYDIDLLDFYRNDKEEFVTDGLTYVLELYGEEKTQELSTFKSFFNFSDYLSGTLIGFNTEINKVTAKIDLNAIESPKTEYNYEVTFPSINKSLSFSGKLKYNYVNNVKIIVEEAVKAKWKENSSYLRTW